MFLLSKVYVLSSITVSKTDVEELMIAVNTALMAIRARLGGEQCL